MAERRGTLVLRFDLSVAGYTGRLSAIEEMSRLGISFIVCEPSSFAECWYFYGCAGNVDDLPAYVARTERPMP